MQIQDFMDIINNESTTGSVGFHAELDECGFSEPYLPTDIAIFYDYCTDDMDEPTWDAWDNWYQHMLARLADFMDANGWEAIDENDGSGGGLYYGAILYRQR